MGKRGRSYKEKEYDDHRQLKNAKKSVVNVKGFVFLITHTVPRSFDLRTFG